MNQSYKKILCFSLAAVLSASMLTACGNSEKTAASETTAEENPSSNAEEASVSEETKGTEAETTAAETEPLILNPDGSKVIISLEEHSITYGMLRMGIEQQKAYYEESALSYLGSELTAEQWQETLSNGTTIAEDLSAQVQEYLTENMVAASHAEDYQVSLSDSEKSDLLQSAKSQYESLDHAVLEACGATVEDWCLQLERAALYEKVMDAALTDYDPEIKEEDARTMSYQIFAIALEGTETGAELPSLEEAQANVDDIFERIHNGEDAKTVVEEYGYSIYEDSVSVNQYEDEFVDRILKLKDGEMTSFQPDENNLYAVICTSAQDPELTAERLNTLQDEAIRSRFAEMVVEWVSEAELTVDDAAISEICNDVFSE